MYTCQHCKDFEREDLRDVVICRNGCHRRSVARHCSSAVLEVEIMPDPTDYEDEERADCEAARRERMEDEADYMRDRKREEP